MFANKTAWFSKSCDTLAPKAWVDNGGKLADVSLAQFVFSDDWKSDDTKNLLTSEAYLDQHLAVFSSKYVPHAAAEGDENVVLGAYFLVPDFIQKRIAEKVVYDGRHLALNNQEQLPQFESTIRSSSSHGEERAGQNHLQNGTVSSSQSQPSTSHSGEGEQRARPSQFPQEDIAGPSSSSSSLHRTHAPEQTQSQSNSNSSLAPSSPKRKRKEQSADEIDTDEINTENVPHVKDLPKFIGPVSIFCPGAYNAEAFTS